ncbi:putative Adenine nucleotide alpha hydrolases-like superfamily protein [Cocos nucifera]|uniref:Putative Adenine nucleotide alpha hydrolases-like superfamily protein n=1 Tax=Cocos nucifera TaxID=13894 RepID=A0A8K0N2Y7_COCNU|nr:putative Adenine nucleotide alpha hydrolases-like superfamily protein [Cocos nucifera]
MAEGEGETKKRVMVAIDESECSHHALEWALTNLRDSLSSPLLIFTVQPLQNVSFLAAASYGSPLAKTSKMGSWQVRVTCQGFDTMGGGAGG